MGEAARLVPASVVADQIREAQTKCWKRNPERFKWTRNSTVPFQFVPPENGDWNRMARAVWVDDRVLGIVVALIDRECLAVTEMLAISYEPGLSIAYARALVRFVDGLIDTHCNVRWSYIEGNPVGRKWERFARQRGGGVSGRIAGAWLVDGVLRDGITLWVPGRIQWGRDDG